MNDGYVFALQNLDSSSAMEPCLSYNKKQNSIRRRQTLCISEVSPYPKISELVGHIVVCKAIPVLPYQK